MELKHDVQLLWRWSWLVVVLMLLPGAAAYAISKQIQPVYQASTSLLVNQAPANSMTIDYNALRASEGLAKNYVPLLVQRPVLAAVRAGCALRIQPMGDWKAQRLRYSQCFGQRLLWWALLRTSTALSLAGKESSIGQRSPAP